MEGLNRLQVYQKAQELANMIYQCVLPILPLEEKYNLTSQIRRAAVSIPANIAEGFGRYYYQETIRFCYLARGSLMELSSHIDLATEQGYIQDNERIELSAHMDEVLKLIHGYIKYLKRNKRGTDDPGAKCIGESGTDYDLQDEENR